MKKINFYIKKYLESRPFFYVFIRPQEAMLFDKYKMLVKTPSLDFGCGDGFFVKNVFGKKKVTFGLDLENSRISEAVGIYKNLKIYEGKKIPYPDGYFRSVISNCVLEHLPDLNLSLKEIFRVLKPGGYFITTVMTEKWEDYIFAKNLMKNMQQHLNLFSFKKWRRTFQKTGFKIVAEIGYLSRHTACYNELSHFLSFPSLISYMVFKKWVLWPEIFKSKSFSSRIRENIDYPVPTDQSAAVFYVLKKLV